MLKIFEDWDGIKIELAKTCFCCGIIWELIIGAGFCMIWWVLIMTDLLPADEGLIQCVLFESVIMTLLTACYGK